MRVHINGLKLLIMSSTLDFENEDEVIITLVYEKLRNYCTLCLNLSHEKHECKMGNRSDQGVSNEAERYQNYST